MSIADPIHHRVVLVAEDEDLIRLVAAEALRSVGISVLEVKDATEAIGVLANTTGIKLVFTDVRMPGKLDGIDLARFVKQNYPETHVLLTSADFNPFGLHGFDELDIDFIEKPYVLDFLIKKVSIALDKQFQKNRREVVDK